MNCSYSSIRPFPPCAGYCSASGSGSSSSIRPFPPCAVYSSCSSSGSCSSSSIRPPPFDPIRPVLCTAPVHPPVPALLPPFDLLHSTLSALCCVQLLFILRFLLFFLHSTSSIRP